jgi:hypothetical protein
MNVLNRTPQNTNYLQPTKFLVTFDRIPNTTYFCQSVNLPGISIGQAPINYPALDVYAPGNKITYNNLTMSFTVNENMDSWKDIHNWFRSIAAPSGMEERNRLSAIQNAGKPVVKPWYSDGVLTILNNLNNPVVRVQFTNMFPVSLSDIQFDTKMSADDIITSDVTFVYEQFEFLPV